ncbi:conserved protein of unknown function [Bradyrhizobium sp. ORS 285]|nr:conserved hypothetical protein [Bradyrhizobium sp. ORS 285]SMX62238.1 conserved protein of unknown function [Bradyrhizobium sp. ORS 285]
MRWMRRLSARTRGNSSWRVDEGAVAYGEIVWSWPPDAEVKPASDLSVTVANKPGAPGRVRISHSNHCAGKAGCAAHLW